MPKAETEAKRYARKNEEKIIESLDSIKTSLGNQDVSIAVIRTKAEETEKHLGVLNGKVIAHESRMQMNEAATQQNSQNITSILKSQDRATNFLERNWEKLFWTVVACSWAYYIAHK